MYQGEGKVQRRFDTMAMFQVSRMKHRVVSQLYRKPSPKVAAQKV